MERYVALLRGIAPSGENMTSDKVRGVFEELGFAAVGSVRASGNITFSTAEADVPTLETRIEEALVSVMASPAERSSANPRSCARSSTATPFPD